MLINVSLEDLEILAEWFHGDVRNAKSRALYEKILGYYHMAREMDELEKRENA